MAAVANVIVHRPGKPGFPATVHGVIYEKNQFSSMTIPTDREFKLNPSDDRDWLETPDGKAWQSTKIIVENLGSAPDPSKGALYYANPKAVAKGEWFERHISGADWKGLPGHELLTIVGDHYFFA